jgi:leader peptidase (prepilin peptidase)/N-methyltransferase
MNKSIVRPRSSCSSCGHQLNAIELIPVISYLILKGKCRSCSEHISPIYPFMEFITGILFVSAPLVIGWESELLIAWTLISLLVIIVVSDISYKLIPDKILIFFAGIFLFERIYLPLTPWWDSILGSLIGFTILLMIAIVSKGGMGGGDIKLFALIGFVVGTQGLLLSFFLASFFGATYGIIGMTFKRLKRKQAIAFGPFIAIGTLTAYYFGDELVSAYIKFITDVI